MIFWYSMPLRPRLIISIRTGCARSRIAIPASVSIRPLMLEAPRHVDSRVFYRIFNSDGGEVEQCGNGARCIAALMYSRRPELGRELTLESPGGLVHARMRDDGQVSVDMGTPNFDPRSLPLDAPAELPAYTVDVEGARLEIGAVSMGNPHAVLRVADVESAPVERFGPLIERHPRFPRRVNVGFMQIVDRGHIRLRVYERGVGETRACGTGACGAVAVGSRWGLLDPEVRVDLPGGTAIVLGPARTAAMADGTGDDGFLPDRSIFNGTARERNT